MAVSTHNYTRTNTAIYVSDKVRNLMRLLIINYGLDPTELVDAWSDWVQDAARQWMEDGDLRGFAIEFYKPGASAVSARWEFPIRYDGSDIDQMWIDTDFLKGTFAKAPAPPAGCTYRILLQPTANARPLPGIGDASKLSLAGLTAREAGTVIGTPDIMASARYYR
ncbi:hypothetical protein [Rhizobium sp. YS-1r]|uniref:hypothetical protein n=1 Tax=Rhizobium sp. YS-1r TaxID=1532558 RepID=UPI00050EAD8E|nr:hypothetical protein [Rhizobium sp. YS-1r]KGE01843.1 hypothetical protein JL39_03520 [Rhizobium sp. YS-1r]